MYGESYGASRNSISLRRYCNDIARICPVAIARILVIMK